MALGWRDQYTRYKDFFLNIAALYKQRRDLRAFLELILSLTTVIIFVVFALKPTALTIISLLNTIKEKKATVAALNQKIEDLQTANSVFSQNETTIPDVDDAIFSNPQPDTVSKQILGLSTKDSLSITGISIGQVVITGKVTKQKASSDVKPLPENAQPISVSISLKGNYSGILSFVKDLENLRIPVKVDTLTISSSQSEAGQVVVALISARAPYIGTQ